MRAGRRAWVVGAAAGVQLLGAAGFVFAPDAVFADIHDDPLARFCLRLAAFAHVSAAVATLALLPRADVGQVRILAGAAASYHVFAGAAAAWAMGSREVVLASPTVGPLAVHAGMGLALAALAAAPAR